MADPIINWPGGKRKIASNITAHFPHHWRAYHEPFLGSGAIFFRLMGACETPLFKAPVFLATLGDLNVDLVTTYQQVQTNTRAVVDLLEYHKAMNSAEHFRSVRYCLNADGYPPHQRAAAFIYLSKAGFNGLYRVNGKGEYNTAYGQRADLQDLDIDNIEAVGRILYSHRIDVVFQDFEGTDPGHGDLVYCDPPYYEQFDRYTPAGFSYYDQARLRDRAFAWRNAGAHVFVSNSDRAAVRELYEGASAIHEIGAPRSIAADPDSRGLETELLIQI